eukprot:scaffold323420_cov21-Tisochrysis_lutea.AAC.1
MSALSSSSASYSEVTSGFKAQLRFRPLKLSQCCGSAATSCALSTAARNKCFAINGIEKLQALSACFKSMSVTQ